MLDRQIKIPTLELGEIRLNVIWEVDGLWRSEWDVLRSTELQDLFSKVTWEDLQHALNGLSRPLVDSLGLPPQGCLRKLPEAYKQCRLRRRCIWFDKRACFPTTAKELPFCYEAEVEEQPEMGENSVIHRVRVVMAITKAITLWREGLYIVVVPAKDKTT